jgi:hypothetical protein
VNAGASNDRAGSDAANAGAHVNEKIAAMKFRRIAIAFP